MRTTNKIDFIKIDNSDNFIHPVWIDSALIKKGSIKFLMNEIQKKIHAEQTDTSSRVFNINSFGKVLVRGFINRVEICRCL